MPTPRKGLNVLAAGKELKLLNKIKLERGILVTPVAANGTLYVGSKNYLWAVKK